MKKTLLFLLVMALLGTIDVTGQAWAQVIQKIPLLPPPKTVFVSSQTYTGNLGGLIGADQKCQALAKSAGLIGTYKAWLSIGSANPDTTFNKSSGPYQLRTGTVVAQNWASLVTRGLEVPIDYDEYGRHVEMASQSNPWAGTPHPLFAWTGIQALYTTGQVLFYPPGGVSFYSQLCSGWTIGTFEGKPGVVYGGIYGYVNAKVKEYPAQWTAWGAVNYCNFTGHIYCFQQ